METGISLGSNLGDRLAFLTTARRRMAEWPDVSIVAASPVYETEPMGVRPEYTTLKFLNAVLILEGPWDAHEWFRCMRQLEVEMGRKRTLDQYAPRVIDLDLIYVGNCCVASGGLVIPHPQWSRRRFVVQPLADVRPDLVLPGESRTVRQVLEALPPTPKVELFAQEW